MAKTDSILGCAALLRDAETRCALAFSKWTEANKRFKGMLDRPEGEPVPGTTALDTGWLQATASYEALLDSQRLKFDLAQKLARLKADDAARRGGPPRRLITQRPPVDRETLYARLRAQGVHPAQAFREAGYTPGVGSPIQLDADPRIVALIAQFRRTPSAGGSPGPDLA